MPKNRILQFEQSRKKDHNELSDYWGTETVLIAEDDDQFRDLTSEILKRQGYSLLVASDGQEALDLLQKHDGTLHLLLTDVIMPEMNGIQLSKKVEELHPHV